MAMFDFNFSPSNRQLRQFGAVCMVAVPLVTWLWTGDAVIVGWAAGVGVTLCGIGFASPQTLKPVFVGLTIATMPIGLVVGELAMLLLYFGVFLPMSIVLRIVGRDSLRRRSPVTGKSFWQERKIPTSVRNYYHQF
jgi:hypothetical protein